MALRARLISVGLILLLAGCGGGPGKTVPVSGQVTLDGKPLAKALVTFVPAARPGVKERLPSSLGTTGEDGRYSLVLNTDSKTSGAVMGKHQVMITVGAEGSSGDTKPTFHKQLPEKYNRKTELTCDVPDGGRADANFDLKSR
jgi:hypothetical protein